MASRAGVGRSRNRNSVEAGREAARAALAPLEGRSPTAVLAFGTAGHDQGALLRGITELTGTAPLVGCSAEGVITHHGSEEASHAVAVAAIQGDGVVARAFFVPGFSTDATIAGHALARQIAHSGVRGSLLVLFPDGIAGNCTELVRAIEASMPYPVAIVGGTAGDLLTFQRTFQYHGAEVASGGVSALLLAGEIHAEIEVTHGCDLIGGERVVTRADGGFVREIDGLPAWSFFKEYLAEDADTLETLHLSHLLLAERIEDSTPEFGDFTVRVPVQLDAARGSLYFAAGIASGTRVQLARRNPEKVCDRAAAAARRLLDRRPTERPFLVLDLDCAGRGALLFGGETTQRLFEPVQQVVGKDVPWIGLHTYGEIGPIGGRTLFHNYTAVLCALYAGRAERA
jgi:hypothetical protein